MRPLWTSLNVYGLRSRDHGLADVLEIGPGVDTGGVAIGPIETKRVGSNFMNALEDDALLLRWGHFPGAVSATSGTGTRIAQKIVGVLQPRAVAPGDEQASIVAVIANFHGMTDGTQKPRLVKRFS